MTKIFILLTALFAAQIIGATDTNSDEELQADTASAQETAPPKSLITSNDATIEVPYNFCEFTDRHLAPDEDTNETMKYVEELEKQGKSNANGCCKIQ